MAIQPCATELTDIEEINRYQAAVDSFFRNEIDEERFTSIRLQQGIYGQRQPGVNMIRIKIPGGLLNADQLDSIADVLSSFSQHDVAHITTRQAIQVHYVPLEKTPDAMRVLAKTNLTSREACNNTVRNMSACSLAGVCPREHTDINVHQQAAVLHFLRNPLNQQLPRKFKISFSACETDCAQGMLHDLGVIAVHQPDHPQGPFGFKILAGGGLGHKPREAIVVAPFIPEHELIAAMEAVITLHNKYSDRVKRAKARIKFLVEKFGVEGFIEKFNEEFERSRAALAVDEQPKGEWSVGDSTQPAPGASAPRRPLSQKQSTKVIFPVSVPMGNLTAIQMHALAKLAREHQLMLRTVQDQNLLFLNVDPSLVETLKVGIEAIGLSLPISGDDVVACPGTSTCRLGITSSPVVAPKIMKMQIHAKSDLRIRVSGCHNGCAQPEMADIGIYGEGRRMHGKLVPHYQMYFGGDGLYGKGLALKGPSVPAARVESAIARVRDNFNATHFDGEDFFNWTRRQPENHFTTLLDDIIKVDETELLSVLRDHGSENDFKVLQLGGGECAGAMQVQIGAAFYEAGHERQYRDALYFQRKYTEAVQCAESVLKVIAQGLYTLKNPAAKGAKAAAKPDNLRELQTLLQPLVPESLVAGYASALSALDDATANPDINTTKVLAQTSDQWITEAAVYCVEQDGTLDLHGAMPATALAPAVSVKATAGAAA
ncbi:MAG: nitrite/sulfite reductase [Pseudomonadota bacterium]